jgi:tetratricopeptide (TPR) repeat protein
MMPEYYDLLTHYESMARELGNPELLGAFYARLGDCEYWLGEFDRAIQTLTKAVKLCEAAGSAEEAARAHLRLEWSHFVRGDFDRALDLKEEFIRIMDRRSSLRWHPYALSVASRAYACLGRWEEAVEEAQKAVRIAEELSDNSLISWSAWNLSIAYNWKGDSARAIEYAEIAFRKAPTPGDKALAQRGLGWAWCRAGEPSKGIELLIAVQPILRAALTASEIPLMCYLGEGYWLAGDDDKAWQTLEKGLETMERCGARYYAGFAQRLLGEIAMKTNPAQSGEPLAAPHFEKSIAIFQEIKAENELALDYAGYGRLHKQKGQIAQAREYLAKALEIFERLKTPIEPEKIKEILAELPEA